MLVLSRKPGETIVMKVGGLEIKVCLLEIYRGQVRIGIQAPNEVEIWRAELTDEKRVAEKKPGLAKPARPA